MGLSNKTATAGKFAIVGFLLSIVSTAVKAANKVSHDPQLGPAAHAASAAATVAIWANWVSAVMAVPLAIATLLYYAAVFYESKLFKDTVAWWRAKCHPPG